MNLLQKTRAEGALATPPPTLTTTLKEIAMTAAIDLTGQRFGRLVVLERSHAPRSDTHAYWRCICDCGQETVTMSRCLRKGESKSCGCFHDEAVRTNNWKHGGSRTRLYCIWANMHSRCYNSNERGFKRYGGRGIYICEEWKNNFAAFQSWSLDNDYAANLTIDRIDNDGPYAPHNCRWATYKEQCRNTSRNRLITFEGETLTVAEWTEKLGLTYRTIYQRLNRGWSTPRALTTPLVSRMTPS